MIQLKAKALEAMGNLHPRCFKNLVRHLVLLSRDHTRGYHLLGSDGVRIRSFGQYRIFYRLMRVETGIVPVVEEIRNRADAYR